MPGMGSSSTKCRTYSAAYAELGVFARSAHDASIPASMSRRVRSSSGSVNPCTTARRSSRTSASSARASPPSTTRADSPGSSVSPKRDTPHPAPRNGGSSDRASSARRSLNMFAAACRTRDAR